MHKKTNNNRQRTINAWARYVPSLLTVFCSLFFVVIAHAQELDAGLLPLTATGLATTDLRVIIANSIRIFLGLLGIIAIVLVLYGGFLWMTSQGNEEKIDKAKKILTNAAIGLAIILSAYGITVFIISRFLGATTGEGGFVDDGVAPGGGRRGSLGGGIVASHYPERSATGIPRNTNILVTFKESMRDETIIGDDGMANGANVKLRKTIANPPTARDFVQMKAATPDNKTFVFDPVPLLGSPSEPISYTIRFEKGLKKANGQDAFGQFGTYYEWQFEVSTLLDTEPPKILDVLPQQGAEEPRNAVIQVTFSEAIDPTVVVGDETVSKIVVADTVEPRVKGDVSIANQYRTIEFLTREACGKNSCGGTVFCLREKTDITVTVPSAALKGGEGDGAFAAALPYNGVVDLAGNALDGNGDGKADGKDVDTRAWSFKTNDTIDLVPPKIETLDPSHNSGRIPLDKEIAVTFTKRLKVGTFNPATVKLESLVNNTPKLDINYWTVTALTPDEKKTIGIIRHDPFLPNISYTPTITAGVQDSRQNCYFPCAGPGCSGTRWTNYPSCKLP